MDKPEKKVAFNERKLKNFIIYPELQWKLIFMCMGISLVAPLTVVVFQIFSFSQQMKSGQLADLPETHPYFVFLKSFQQQMLFVLGASVLVSFVICVVLGVLMSHKVAGPLVKLRNYFDGVAEGDAEKAISFRDGDFFQDLAAAYNRRFKK